MKCDKCPARSKDSNFTGCLALKHSIQDYNGCNRTEEKIRAELAKWMANATADEMNRYCFWQSCGLNSSWISARALKSKLEMKG